MNLTDIERLTLEYGEAWAHPHARRLLKLVDEIGSGLEYDRQVMAYAAYLPDWGATPHFRQAGVAHPARSRQVAEAEILPHTSLSAGQTAAVLAAIELHDYRDLRPAAPLEALLLREADGLDLLGAVGIARELAWGPNDLPAVVARIRARMAGIPPCLTLPRAIQIAATRLAEMEIFLSQLQTDSFDIL